jgi:DNA-binding transcriptional regulator WhiA
MKLSKSAVNHRLRRLQQLARANGAAGPIAGSALRSP